MSIVARNCYGVAVVFALMIGSICPLGRSQTAPAIPSPSTQPTKDLVTLTFPENLELRVFVQYVSKRLNLNILYDEQVGAQKITVQSPEKIPASSLLDLLRGILKVKGLALVNGDQPGWKKIVPAANLNAIAQPTSQPAAGKPDATVAVARVFKLRYLDPQRAEQILKTFLTQPGGSTIPLPEQSAIVVTDYADNVKRIGALLDLIDKERDLKTQFVQLINSEAAQVAQQATSIIAARTKSTGGAGSAQAAPTVELIAAGQTNQIAVVGQEGAVKEATDLIRTIDAPLGLKTQVYRFSSADPERVDHLAREVIGPLATKRLYRSVADKEGNQLIVTTTPEFQRQVAELQKELDVPMAASQSPIRYYKLSNATAADVLATIKALQGERFSSAAVNLGPTSQPGQTGGTPSGPLTVGPATLPPPTAAIPPATPMVRGYQGPSITPVPAGGDTQVTHESVRTKDATVTADKNTNTIIVVAAPEVQHVYEQMIQMLDKRRPQVLIECTVVTIDTSHNFNLGVEISGAGGAGSTKFINFSNFGLDTASSTGQLTLTPGLGFNGAVINADIGQVIVHALQTDSRAKVLSSPRILVNDNATGTLASVNEQPTTSINASTTVSTTSFGGYQSAGTTVTLTPHISEGDHLQLEYAVTLSTFANTSTATGIPPPRQTDTVQSEITVPDGSMIIVGGLNRADSSKTVNGIPFLANIPVIGALFSSRSTTHSKDKLFVFIRPVILRDDNFADLKYISERELKAAELPGNYPVSKPIIMN